MAQPFDSLRLTDPVRLRWRLLQGCATVIAAARWRMLLANQGIQLSRRRAVRLTLIGVFFNLFFLGSVGGDAARFAGTLGNAATARRAGAVAFAGPAHRAGRTATSSDRIHRMGASTALG